MGRTGCGSGKFGGFFRSLVACGARCFGLKDHYGGGRVGNRNVITAGDFVDLVGAQADQALRGSIFIGDAAIEKLRLLAIRPPLPARAS